MIATFGTLLFNVFSASGSLSYLAKNRIFRRALLMLTVTSYKKRLIVCFAGVLLALCFHHFISNKIEFVAYSNGNLKIQDYAYHIIIVKAFWFESFGNIYDLSFQQQALSAYVGSKIYTVMPLGITPIALIVWLPFAYAARFGMALSYTLWITFSVFVLFAALWQIGRNLSLKESLPLLPITLSLVTLFSATTFFAIILGQTSVLAAGLLIYLIYFVHKTANQSKSSNWLIILLLIFILGIKPTYIALGLGLLIIYGMWREALYSIAIVLVCLIGITPMLGVEWVSSYLNLLRMYSHGKFPEFYSWAIVPETMNIFRSAFRSFIGDNIAGMISNTVSYSVYIGVVGMSILFKIKNDSINKLYFTGISRDQLFVVLVGSYLLFAPYAGGYEDVLFLSVFVMVLHVDNTPALTNYKSFVLIFALLIILLQSYFPLDKPLWLFWILKALIIGYMLHFCRLQSQNNEISEEV